MTKYIITIFREGGEIVRHVNLDKEDVIAESMTQIDHLLKGNHGIVGVYIGIEKTEQEETERQDWLKAYKIAVV